MLYGFRNSAYHPDNQYTTFFLCDCTEIEARRFGSNFIDPIEANRRRSASWCPSGNSGWTLLFPNQKAGIFRTGK